MRQRIDGGAQNREFWNLEYDTSSAPFPSIMARCAAIFVALACALVCVRATFEDDARTALSQLGGSQSLADAVRQTAAQLDMCGDASDAANYVANNGGIGQIVAQAAAIDDAIAHCTDKSHLRFDAAYAAALRDTISDMGHHLKFVRALLAPCIMVSPDQKPPDDGAWALNTWLRDARDVLQSNSCVTFGSDDTAAQKLPEKRAPPHCSCAKPVLVAVFTAVGSTACIAIMMTFLLTTSMRSLTAMRRTSVAMPNTDGAGAVLTPRSRSSAGGPFMHVEPGPLLEMGLHHVKSPRVKERAEHPA